MNNQEILQKLRRLNTLLVLGKRSNNLAQAIRRAMDNIASWRSNADEIIAKSSIRQIFAGYGPKFIRIFNELMQTGDIAMIHELQPEFDPFFCFLCEIPGIGETMARRMFFERSIHTMDDLRIAYTNNVLQRIPAFGDSRLRAIEILLWNSQNDASYQKLWVDMASNAEMQAASEDADSSLSSNDLFADGPKASEHDFKAHHASHSSMQLELFIPENVQVTDLPHEYSASDSDVFHTAQKNLSLTNVSSIRPALPDDAAKEDTSAKEDNAIPEDLSGNDEPLNEKPNETDKNAYDDSEEDDEALNDLFGTSDEADEPDIEDDEDFEDITDHTTEFAAIETDIHAQSCELLNVLNNGQQPPEQAAKHASYSREFIESNSALFRENDARPQTQLEHELEEDDLNEFLKAPAKPEYDPKVAAELEAFIAEDLREHGMDASETKNNSGYDMSIDGVRASNLRVHVLHANHIEANIIHAKLIRAEKIQMNSQNMPVLSSANIEQEMMYTSHVTADIIDADIVEVRTLCVHYLDARIIG